MYIYQLFSSVEPFVINCSIDEAKWKQMKDCFIDESTPGITSIIETNGIFINEINGSGSDQEIVSYTSEIIELSIISSWLEKYENRTPYKWTDGQPIIAYKITKWKCHNNSETFSIIFQILKMKENTSHQILIESQTLLSKEQLEQIFIRCK